MKIEFIRIEIQNFKSIGEKVILDYQNLKGLTFVYGNNIDVPNAKNGSGKTTLMIDSIVFALFGKTLKNTNNKYIPNRNVSPDLKPYVKLYFKSDDVLYSCEAFGRVVAKVMGTVGMELKKLDDQFNVVEDLTQSSIIKTRQYIMENILGCSFDIFKSSIIVSYADFMNFYEGMGKDQKRKYVESIFNLNCFGEMYNYIKSDLNDTKKEITSTKNEILKTNQLVEDLTNKFELYNNSLKEKQDVLKQKIIDKVNEIKNLEKDKDTIIVESNDDLIEKRNKIQTSINSLVDETHSLEKKKFKDEMTIKHIDEMISEMKSISEGLCEKCTILINNRYDYENKRNEIDKLNQSIKILIDKINSNKEENDKNKESLDELNKLISKNDENIRKAYQFETKIKIMKSELVSMKQSFDELKNEVENPFTSLLENTKTELKNLKDRLINFNKNLKHLEIIKDACSENGIKKVIIKDIVKLLNSLIQKYLNEIGCEFIVYFDETFEFKFITSTGECEFSSFSAGERQRIQIATILAFRDLILNGKISSNIFIIDELLDANIDTVCIENVMRILKKKTTEYNQSTFIISHRSELAENDALWDNIIKVTKENGQSTYEVN